MKIAWFTPFHRPSAIGRFSRLVTAELAKLADVDIWHPVSDDPHQTELRTIPFQNDVPVDPDALQAYDICVYNMGDHSGYHGSIFQVSRRVPGIVVLHDFVMHHFFTGYYLLERQSPHEYIDAMVRLYGEPGRSVAEPAMAGQARGVWDTDRVVEFPFFEDAVRGAHGVVVHSQFLKDAVARCFPGPVQRLFLAYDATQPTQRVSRADLQIPAERLLVVTVGNANPNKRILEVIEAIGSEDSLSRRVFYLVLGACEGEYRERLDAAVRDLGLGEAVRFTGYASDEMLASSLTQADVCVNLRNPAMEGASASVLEEMLYGKPVIVTDSGFYRELPPHAVYKVASGNEVAGAREGLLRFLEDRVFRETMGASARSFALENANPVRYASGFRDFAVQVADSAPVLRFSDRMAAHLASMGVSAASGVVERLAQNTYDLFCANGREIRKLPD